MSLSDPRTPLNELVTAISAIQLPAEFGAYAAFESVRIFDLQDLFKAMEELFLYGNRICMVGMDAVTHSNTVSGQVLTVDQTLQVSLIFADRRFENRQTALMGDATTPGALLLQNLLLNGITGKLPCGAIVQPDTGRLFSIEGDKRRNETGRIAFVQDIDISIDTDSVSLGRRARIGAL